MNYTSNMFNFYHIFTNLSEIIISCLDTEVPPATYALSSKTEHFDWDKTRLIYFTQKTKYFVYFIKRIIHYKHRTLQFRK